MLLKVMGSFFSKLQVEELYDTVQKFTLCAHLLWSAWAMYQVPEMEVTDIILAKI